MSLTVILVLCLAAGIVFAGIAAWLTTKKGNTISDVLNSSKFADAEALKIEILDKIKLRSNVPIVGLYFVAAVVAVALPAYISYLNRSGDPLITLQGQLQKRRDVKVDIIPSDMRVEESGVFKIPIMYRSGVQTINIQSQAYEPLTLSIKLNKDQNLLTVRFSNENMTPEEIKVDDATRVAEIQQRMKLYESSLEHAIAVANWPSQPKALTPAVSMITGGVTDTTDMVALPGGKI